MTCTSRQKSPVILATSSLLLYLCSHSAHAAEDDVTLLSLTNAAKAAKVIDENFDPQVRLNNSSSTISQGWPDALAAFIVDRAKAEVAASILTTVQDYLASNDPPHLPILFEATAQEIRSLQATGLSKMGFESIKAKYHEDVDALAERFPKWIAAVKTSVDKMSEGDAKKRLTTAIAAAEDYAPILAASAVLFARIRHGDPFHTILEDCLRDGKAQFHVSQNQTNLSLMTMGYAFVVAKANMANITKYRNEPQDNKKNQGKNEPNERDKLWAGFTGIVWEDGKVPPFITAHLEDCKNNLVNAVLAAGALIKKYDAIKQDMDDALRDVKNPNGPTLYLQFTGRIKDLWDSVTPISVAGVPNMNEGTFKVQVEKTKHISDGVYAIHSDIIANDYSSGTIHTIGLMSELIPQYVDQRIAKYLVIAGRAASASTSEEKYAFINSIADPLSDFLNKRSNPGFYVTLNSYVGIAYGYEILEGQHWEDRVEYYGITAPVGPEFGMGGLDWQFGTGRNIISYVGVLGSVLNLGNLASNRLGSSDTGPTGITNTDASVSKVIAPGAFLLVGISSKYPITIGFGGERAPDIRETSTGESLWGTHWSAFIGIDVPLIGLSY